VRHNKEVTTLRAPRLGTGHTPCTATRGVQPPLRKRLPEAMLPSAHKNAAFRKTVERNAAFDLFGFGNCHYLCKSGSFPS
jgi:hypothetical protein